VSSGDITVSGGGRTIVSTEDLDADAAALDRVGVLAGGARAELIELAAAPSAATPYIWAADRALADARDAAVRLRTALLSASAGYTEAERASLARSGWAADIAGVIAGGYAPAAIWGAIAALPMLAAAFGISGLIAGSPDRVVRGLGAYAVDHRGVLRDPRVVELTRRLVTGADDAILVAAGVPPLAALALDDRASGWYGLKGATRSVIGLAPGALLDETSVTVTPAGRSGGTAPTGYRELAQRIPASAPGAPQVRIERYDVGGPRPRWIVYVGGTVDTGFAPHGEPWDDTSNLGLIAGGDAASVRATREAMAAAGVRPGDAVLPVGYSQGGVVATDLVTGGDYDTSQLVTFGSPSGQLDVPQTVTDVALEHRDDIIPALGGEPLGGPEGADRIVVRRTTFEGAVPMDESPLAAHRMSEYELTAAAVDSSSDPRLVGAADQLRAFTDGAAASVTYWRADRVELSGEPADAGADP
jgi:hypothetical protein